jgi:hypothetical protein
VSADNVRCASCGWTGLRNIGKGAKTWLRGAKPEHQADPAWAQTAKPCPRCGGQVARIQPEPTP